MKKPLCELCGTLRALRFNVSFFLERIPGAKLAKDRKARGVGWFLRMAAHTGRYYVGVIRCKSRFNHRPFHLVTHRVVCIIQLAIRSYSSHGGTYERDFPSDCAKGNKREG